MGTHTVATLRTMRRYPVTLDVSFRNITQVEKQTVVSEPVFIATAFRRVPVKIWWRRSREARKYTNSVGSENLTRWNLWENLKGTSVNSSALGCASNRPIQTVEPIPSVHSFVLPIEDVCWKRSPVVFGMPRKKMERTTETHRRTEAAGHWGFEWSSCQRGASEVGQSRVALANLACSNKWRQQVVSPFVSQQHVAFIEETSPCYRTST